MRVTEPAPPAQATEAMLNLGDRVVRGAVWSGGATLVSIPVGIVVTIALARVLGPRDFGALAVYTFVTALAMGISDLGVSDALIQRATAALGRGELHRVTSLCRAALSWGLVRTPVVCVVGFVALPGRYAALLFAVGVMVAHCMGGASYYLTATSNVRALSQVKLLAVVISGASSVVTAITTGDPALTFAVSSAGTLLPSVLHFAYIEPHRRRSLLLPGRIDLRGQYGFALASFFNGQLTSFVFSRSEILFFGPSQAVARGAFAVAQTISARATMVIDSLYASLAPGLSTAGGRGADALTDAMARVLRVTSLLVTMCAPAVLALAIVVAVPAFGEGYAGIAWPVAAMTAMALVRTASAPYSAFRFAERALMPLLAAGVGATAVDVLLAVVLIPRMGMTGAAIANVAAGAVHLLVSGGLLARRAVLRPHVGSHVAHMVVVVSSSTGLALVMSVLPVGLPVRVLVSLVASVILSLCLVRVLRPADAQEVGWLLARLPGGSLLLARPAILSVILGIRPAAVAVIGGEAS